MAAGEDCWWFSNVFHSVTSTTNSQQNHGLFLDLLWLRPLVCWTLWDRIEPAKAPWIVSAWLDGSFQASHAFMFAVCQRDIICYYCFNFVSNHSCNKHFVFWCQRLVINHSYGQSPIWMIYLLKPPFIDFPLTFPVPWTLQTLQTLQTLRHVDPQLPAPGRELGSKLCCRGRGVERRVARAKCGGLFFGISWGIQWLVGGLEWILFPFSWECHHPNWLIFFRGVVLAYGAINDPCVFVIFADRNSSCSWNWCMRNWRHVTGLGWGGDVIHVNLTCVTCTTDVTSLGWGGVGMLTFMLTCVTCTTDVTSLGWVGVGMSTFMLTCVTCTTDVTSLGWGGVGMLTFMLTCVTCTTDVMSLGWGGVGMLYMLT